MSPKVVCQQSFFTFAPYARFLPDGLRGLVDLARGPGLQGDLAGAAHLFDDSHFRRIGQLELPCFALYGQQQGFHAAAQLRMRTQPSHQLRITHQRISHGSPSLHDVVDKTIDPARKSFSVGRPSGRLVGLMPDPQAKHHRA